MNLRSWQRHEKRERMLVKRCISTNKKEKREVRGRNESKEELGPTCILSLVDKA